MKSLKEKINFLCEEVYKEVPEVTYEEIIENIDDYPTIAELVKIEQELTAELKRLEDNKIAYLNVINGTPKIFDILFKIEGKIEQLKELLGTDETTA